MTIDFKKMNLLLIAAGCSASSLWAQNMKLWYNQPATVWTEALPIGNGRIGAMIFGGAEKEHLQFNEETLWTGEPRNYNRKGAYQYLDSIRQLIFEGRQQEAEAMAGEHFMGTKSDGRERAVWLQEVKSLRGVNFNPAAEKLDDQQWGNLTVPAYEGWETMGHEGLDGAVWLRTKFTLPENWMGKSLTLDLGRVRTLDYTYVNGKLVGSLEGETSRKYNLPKEVLHAGENTIAVLVINYDNKGGISGYTDQSKNIAVYPKDQPSEQISLNGQWKYFIQNDEPPAVGLYQASYQPFGDLWLHFKHGEANNYQRSLDISSAVATTTYTANGVDYRREYFASQPNQAVIVQLTANKKSSIDFDAQLTSVHKNYQVRQIDANTIALSVKVRNGALHGESYLRIIAQGGSVKMVNGKIEIRNANEATIYLTAGTNYKNYKDVTADAKQPCINALQSIAGKSYSQVKSAHTKEYQQYFNAFSLNLGTSANEQLPTDERIRQFASSSDPAFVALYVQYGRYLLISSSRPGTRPANLQGIWNDLKSPPWGSKYTTNINAEMNYWPAELLNLSKLHQPLFGMIKELAEAGKETAKEYYNAPGWVLHHNTDAWCGTAAINASNHGIWVTGGAWLCQHLWEHFLFTQDTAFLKSEAYPVMKQAALFFNSFLIRDPATGYLISTPSNSPEQGGLVAGPTMDHQIIRALFKNVIAASEVLNTDAALRKTWQEKYGQIAPNKIGRYGQLQEWMQDMDDTTNKHRHVSHLWGLYPGNEINWEETPDLTKAARQSLLYRGDAATGWSLGWKINFWARFNDGNHSFKMIQMLMSPAENGAGSYPNLFDAHPPFQIDGNFGGAAGVGELLVQSHLSYIDLLPALPEALPSGEVKGICARGGFMLDMQWKEGKLANLTVKSTAGKDLKLRYQGKIITIATTKNGMYEFDGALRKK